MKGSVIVLGGGVGGVIAANLLRKRLSAEYKVTLIDREENHVFAPSLLWLMTGDRDAAAISRPLHNLQEKGIEVVRGDIERIDAENRTVLVNGQSISGDYLIVALGAALAPEDLPGLDTGYSFYDLKEAERLRQQVATFQQGHVVVLTASPVYKCPAAPYEAAMLLSHYFQTHGTRSQIRISFYAAEGGPLAVAGKNVTEAVQQMLQERDIAYHPQHVIQTIDAGAHTLHFANGVQDSYDLLVYVPAHKPPQVIRESGLLGQNGWVEVDRHTLETKVPGVYAIGDVTGIPLEMGKPLPKAGVFAHGQAKVVANNIACKITGKGRLMEFAGHGECFVEIGDHKAGFARGNFYASPSPAVKVFRPGVRWHLGKVAFEKNWFRAWF